MSIVIKTMTGTPIEGYVLIWVVISQTLMCRTELKTTKYNGIAALLIILMPLG